MPRQKSDETTEDAPPVLSAFHFPNAGPEGRTVLAASQEEADALIAKLTSPSTPNAL
jgi:hypothetical protein